MTSALATYGRSNSKEIKSGAITGAQTGFSVSASADIFEYAHVGRSIVFDSGEVCAITDYVSQVVVAVIPKQLVPAGKFKIVPAIWHRCGQPYESELDAGYLDFGTGSREKELSSYAVQLKEPYKRATLAQAAETGLTASFSSPLKLDQWLRLGRAPVTGVAAAFTSKTAYSADGGDPFNPASYVATTDSGVVDPSLYDVDLVNGLVRLKASAAFSLLVNATLVFTFSCASSGNEFRVDLYGGLSSAAGLSLLDSKVLTNPDSGFVRPTHFRKFLFQDRVRINGAHNTAKIMMRAFEQFPVDGRQIGRLA